SEFAPTPATGNATTAPRAVGRPSHYSLELAHRLCQELASTEAAAYGDKWQQVNGRAFQIAPRHLPGTRHAGPHNSLCVAGGVSRVSRDLRGLPATIRAICETLRNSADHDDDHPRCPGNSSLRERPRGRSKLLSRCSRAGALRLRNPAARLFS